MLTFARFVLRVKPLSRGLILSVRRQQHSCLSPTNVYSNLSRRVFSSIDGKKNTVVYKQLQPVEHVLLRPDTYIGSTVPAEDTMWIYGKGRMFRRPCTFSPGLLKIVDEILVNAADNKERDERMTEIRVDIDRDSGSISVWNDGRGLPIERLSIDKTMTSSEYVPSLVFGSLYTSSNYDDNQVKTVGGRNGFGAKLANIFSTEFYVRTASSESDLVFEQTWRRNMSEHDQPIILSQNGEALDYTLVRFTPDYGRFGYDQASPTVPEEIAQLIDRRVHDLAATLKDVRVVLNGGEITTTDFREYASQFMAGERLEDEASEDTVSSTVAPPLFYHYPTKRWEVVIGLRETIDNDGNGTECISFVNNCVTTKGGRHVTHVWERSLATLRPWVEKKIGGVVRPATLKRRLFLFVNAKIDNPTFDSQLKETLVTRPQDFGSEFTIDAKGLLQWAESVQLDERIRADLRGRQKDTSSRRPSSSRGTIIVPKLEDAVLAGGKRSAECSLLLTEGDSAKALAVSGLQVVGRDCYGVYPLRGKLTNISGMDTKAALSVPEVSALVQILGLRPGADYSIPDERRTLRYGRLILFTDQDEDGSHIKGLVMNIFRCLWPSLLKIPFITTLETPLIKARRGSSTVPFYSRREYDRWAESVPDIDRWQIKYYKGLGTSTAAEAREYFSELEDRLVHYVWQEEEDQRSIEIAFDRQKADERKRWIQSGSVTTNIDRSPRELPYARFVNGELRGFALQDLKRSIPSVVDGLKPSQRKILHTCLRLGDNKQEKVAQLASRVAHTCGYHHGEASLVNAIVNMAQDFVGTANVPLLTGIGQFGTRLAGGADAASARYIYAALSPMARALFPAADDALLEPVVEEGVRVEPVWYCPILPLVLINGAEGIATGWSTTVCPYDPRAIMDTVRARIEGSIDNESHTVDMLPYYSGFTGTIDRHPSNGRIRCSGRIDQLKGKSGKWNGLISIDELPVGVWTSPYKERVLLPMVQRGEIRTLRESHTDRNVRFQVELSKDAQEKVKDNQYLLKLFKLHSSMSTGNMVLFDADRRLKTYSTIGEIIDDHFHVRRTLFERRLLADIDRTKEKFARCQNEYLFTSSFLAGKIDGSTNEERERKAIELGCKQDLIGTLLDIPLSKLNRDEEAKLREKIDNMSAELEGLVARDWKAAWKDDLDIFERKLNVYQKRRNE